MPPTTTAAIRWPPRSARAGSRPAPPTATAATSTPGPPRWPTWPPSRSTRSPPPPAPSPSPAPARGSPAPGGPAPRSRRSGVADGLARDRRQVAVAPPGHRAGERRGAQAVEHGPPDRDLRPRHERSGHRGRVIAVAARDRPGERDLVDDAVG